MNLEQTRSMLEYAMDSLESAIIGRDDELSKEIMAAIDQKRQKQAENGEKEAFLEPERQQKRNKEE
jgi:hypothetical protein